MSVPQNQRVSSRKFLETAWPSTAIAAGLIAGLSYTNLNGENRDMDAGTLPETCWPPGGLYPWPTAGFTAHVTSDDPLDTLAGTGAQLVVVKGLDTSWAPRTEVFNMAGVGDVASAFDDWFRINAIIVVQNGAHAIGTNVGTIIAKDAAGAGTTLAHMNPATGLSSAGNFSTSASQKGTVVLAGAQILEAKTGTEIVIAVAVRQNVGPWLCGGRFGVQSLGSSGMTIMPPFSGVVGPMTDFDCRVVYADANAIEILLMVQLLLIDTDLL